MLQEACCSMQQHQADMLDKQASLEQELVASAAVRQQYSALQGQCSDYLTRLEQAQDQVCQHLMQCFTVPGQRHICALLYSNMMHT